VPPFSLRFVGNEAQRAASPPPVSLLVSSSVHGQFLTFCTFNAGYGARRPPLLLLFPFHCWSVISAPVINLRNVRKVEVWAQEREEGGGMCTTLTVSLLPIINFNVRKVSNSAYSPYGGREERHNDAQQYCPSIINFNVRKVQKPGKSPYGGEISGDERCASVSSPRVESPNTFLSGKPENVKTTQKTLEWSTLFAVLIFLTVLRIGRWWECQESRKIGWPVMDTFINF